MYKIKFTETFSIKIYKEDVEDYLKYCKEFNITPLSKGFVDYLDTKYYISENKVRDNIAIISDIDFWNLIREIKND